MDICITGIPVRFWDALRGPIGSAIAKSANEVNASRGKMRVELFSSYGKEQPLLIAFDRRASLWPHRWMLANVVAGLCAHHAREQGGVLWYRGFFINNLLKP